MLTFQIEIEIKINGERIEDESIHEISKGVQAILIKRKTKRDIWVWIDS